MSQENASPGTVRTMLAEAMRLNAAGQHGAALKQAYHASEYVAVAYLSAVTEQPLQSGPAAFEQFSETIQEPGRHPDLLSSVEDVVSDVCVLREAHHPALLDEASS